MVARRSEIFKDNFIKFSDGYRMLTASLAITSAVVSISGSASHSVNTKRKLTIILTILHLISLFPFW